MFQWTSQSLGFLVEVHYADHETRTTAISTLTRKDSRQNLTAMHNASPVSSRIRGLRVSL